MKMNSLAMRWKKEGEDTIEGTLKDKDKEGYIFF